mgnify:CR=1 FL=1
MNVVQEEWEKMRIAYQIRYARMYKKVKENEINTDNHGALLEMSYVLILVFGLTDKQVKEIERNDGCRYRSRLNSHLREVNRMEIYRDGVEIDILPETAKCCADDTERNPLNINMCPIGEQYCSGDCDYYTEN